MDIRVLCQFKDKLTGVLVRVLANKLSIGIKNRNITYSNRNAECLTLIHMRIFVNNFKKLRNIVTKFFNSLTLLSLICDKFFTFWKTSKVRMMTFTELCPTSNPSHDFIPFLMK